MKRWFLAVALAVSGLSATTAASDGKFVAHEWGTFTSVQGADGVQLEWNPFVIAELPTFVYDRNRPNHEANRPNFAVFAAKTALLARQRMETPVIYFYAPEKKSVDVRVDFPSGLMTEWYPHATACDADRGPVGAGKGKGSFLEWKGVEIVPSQDAAGALPMEKGKSHYYAARETEAALVRVDNKAKGTVETEKFLFYRGVGHFEAPLHTSLALDGRMLMLQNRGKEELRSLIVLEVAAGKAQGFRMARHESLGANQFARVPLDGLKAASRAELKAALKNALLAEKLYAAEADSMIKTWEDSWLDESGVRVLYVLGKEWTDATLPLRLTPAPDEVARVMVGRAEVITPAMELALQESIQDYARGGEAARARSIAKARAVGLGRFTEAAVRRLVKRNPDKAFSKAAFELANETARPAEGEALARVADAPEKQNRLTSVSASN